MKFLDDDIFGLSAELTFYLTMSFFPFVILLLTVISITPLSAEDTLYELLSALPKDAYNVVRFVISGVEKSALIILTSGFVGGWSISCAVSTISKALNRMYRIDENRNVLVIRGLGVIFAVLLAMTIILTFFLLVLGNIIGISIVKFVPSFSIIWSMLRFLIVYFVLIIVFSAIYTILPNKKIKYREAVFGALFTTFTWGGASMIFAFYVENFSKYHIVYGSLNGIIVLMMWLYMTSIIVMLGGELNSIIYNKKNKLFK